MEATKIRKYTIAEYLELEENSENKHEFYDGEVFAMSGGTFNHSLISNNIGGVLRSTLIEKGSNCNALNSEMRIALDFLNSFVYPDVSVFCGEPTFSKNDKNSLTNPILIVEVLSDSTRGYDRGEKFWKYKHLASFEEYVIIEQKVPVVEVCSRQKDGSWRIVTTIGLDESIQLYSINCTVSMKDIYHGVKNLKQPTFRLYKKE